MAEEKKQKEETMNETDTTKDQATLAVEEEASEKAVEKTPETPGTTEEKKIDPERRGGGSRGSADGKDSHRGRRNPRRARRGGRREERARSEFDQKIVDIRRVTRVMAGGRRFSFSVSMVIGNKKGKVGVGVGKASDTQLAIEKAARNAKKKLIEVPMNKDRHIPHDVEAKYASSEIMIMPAPGRGLVAGSSVRTVLELAGIKDVTAKVFSRSKNKLNNARATVKALQQLKA